MFKRNFFQDVIRTFFGKLELETALTQVFQFLSTHLPLTALTLDRLDPVQHRLHVQSIVTDKGFVHTDLSIHLTEQRLNIVREFEQLAIPLMVCDCLHHPVGRLHARALQRFFVFAPRCYVVLPLKCEQRVVGHMCFVGTGPDCYTEQHNALLELLADPLALAVGNRIHLQGLVERHHKLDAEKTQLEQEVGRFRNTATIIGAHQGLKQVMETISLLEDKEPPVLLLGETGTGKERIAEVVQQGSRRRNAPFIKINCGAIPEAFLDSELFGYEKGAFTGASAALVGRFEQADGGTLFLDEVGELSLSAQVRLLRVLQDGMVQRIGSNKSVQVNVRIIAATNRNLDPMLQRGQFREDLFHRLNVFPVRVPPLRDRREDIPLLLNHFVDMVARRMGMPVPELRRASLPALMRYPWPGNVRELENLVERALIFDPAGPLDLTLYLPDPVPTATPEVILEALQTSSEHLHSIIDARISRAMGHVQTAEIPHAPAVPLESDISEPFLTLDNLVAQHMRQAIARCKGKIYGSGGAAELLGINHNTLRSRMRKLGIAPKTCR